MNTQENRTESITTASRAPAAAFVAMLVIGYAFSTTQVGSAMDSAPAVTSAAGSRAGSYFPAQYANQGTSCRRAHPGVLSDGLAAGGSRAGPSTARGGTASFTALERIGETGDDRICWCPSCSACA